ncbi:MAG TPA: glycosyltransferase family 4 protein [Solirubrobacterales bacterium]|nr:glycosyltransferase family 4 protein [Solirubrobacterales bacterium]
MSRRNEPEDAERPLRLLVIDEGVLGHRTLKAQLEETLAVLPGVEPTFATVPPPSRLGRLFVGKRTRGSDIDLQALRWRLRWSWQGRKILKRHRRSADVALINTQALAYLAKGPMRELPCVLSIDATVGQFTALEYTPHDSWTPRQLRLMQRLERRAMRAAAAAMPWTETIAAAVRSEYELGGKPMETIHPGLDAGWWAEAAAKRPAPSGGPMRVLFVGNDVHRKGLPTLIEAVTALEGEAVLDVVSGDEIEAREFVRVHRGVSAGTDQLRDLYAGADVFALPTRADAVPWAVLEAMAAGLPVVASGVGSIPEMVGDTGEVVPPGDVEALAAALRRLRDPERRRQLGEAAQARVHERYDNRLQTPRIVALAKSLAEAGGGRRIRRRTFVAVGAGAAAAAVAAPYAALIPDQEFEQLVASRLGIDAELAKQLLERAREEYGDAEYDARAAAFALAVRDPAAAVMPEGARRKAVDGLLEPMLSAPASNLAYAVTGSDPGSPACAGLVRRT